jgi:hypothetical protein
LAVLQCIGHMNTGVSYMAERFMDALVDRRRVVDIVWRCSAGC